MGTDIHFRVEYYGPVETVVQNDNGEIVVQADGDMAWVPAEKYAENKYIVQWRERLKRGEITQEQFDAWSKFEPDITLNYEDRFYTGRNYALFGKLSGVRRGTYNPIVGEGHPRFGTIPEDSCPEIAEELSVDDPDLHSHGWATLTELLEADWSDLERDEEDKYGWSGFGNTLRSMQAVAIEKCGGNTDLVRAIWAYDN